MPRSDQHATVSTGLAKGLNPAAESNHIDLFLLVYLYLRTPVNQNLKPTVFNVGPILAKMSPKLAAPYWGRLRKAAIDRDFTKLEGDSSSGVHRDVTHEALARLCSLGFIEPAGRTPTTTGKAVLRAIHQFADEVRKQQGIDISGEFQEKYRILTKGDNIFVVNIKSDTEVARFTAPEDLPKRTAPENRKRTGMLRTRHKDEFMAVVQQLQDVTGMQRQDIVEEAIAEFAERHGIEIPKADAG